MSEKNAMTQMPSQETAPPLINPEYEKQYDNRARVPEHPAIIAGWERDAEAYRRIAHCDLGLRYGESPRQTYDLFKPETAAGDAIVLFIHGGYWRGLSPAFFSHMARGLNARGVPVAVAGYDLCPQVTIGEIIGQMRACVATLWNRYHVPVVAVGHSAGGHLAACMLATDWSAVAPELPPTLVPAAYAISGIFNLKPLTETSINADLRLSFEESERESPFFWPAPSRLVLDAVVGSLESEEYLKQSRRIVDVWGLSGAVTRYDEIEGANHFTVLDGLANPDDPMTARIAALAGA
jgi:arylformamidase